MKKVKCKKCGLTTVLQNDDEDPGDLCVTCAVEKKQDEAYKKFVSTPGCPSCDGVLKLCADSKITFSLKNHGNDKNGEYNKYVKYILPFKKLKYGTLCKCVNCQVNWWLDDNNKTIFPIAQEKLSVLEKWNLKRYTLSIGQFLALSKIKKDFSISYNYSIDYEFPCSIVSNNNIRYERAIILISKVPPVDKNPKFVLFSDEIREIIFSEGYSKSALDYPEMDTYYFYVDAARFATIITHITHYFLFPTKAEAQRYRISRLKTRLAALFIFAVVIIFLQIRQAYPSHGWLCGVDECKFFNVSGKEVKI